MGGSPGTFKENVRASNQLMTSTAGPHPGPSPSPGLMGKGRETEESGSRSGGGVNSRFGGKGSQRGNGGGAATLPGRLSRACQIRRFNPQFMTIYKGGWLCKVNLGNAVTLVTEKTFAEAQEAKDCVAQMGLDYLHQHPNFNGHKGSLTTFSRPPLSQAPPLNSAIRPATEQHLVASNSRHLSGRSTVDLPGNVEPKTVQSIVERAIAGGGISFNLPGSVSVQVAEAYGRAIGELTRPRQSLSSRARTRSRSPPREPRFERSRRERERSYRGPYDYYRPS
jgi:hypothetical protein